MMGIRQPQARRAKRAGGASCLRSRAACFPSRLTCSSCQSRTWPREEQEEAPLPLSLLPSRPRRLPERRRPASARVAVERVVEQLLPSLTRRLKELE